MRMLVVTFVCGTAYEVMSVWWVYATENIQPFRAALWSALQAFLTVTGIGYSLDNHAAKLCFILGYAFGSYIAVKLKTK